jgi:WD40 repeat protein
MCPVFQPQYKDEVSIYNLAWSSDNKYLVTGGDNSVQIWKTDDWTQGIKLDTEVNDYFGKWITSVAWSPDGNYLVSGNEEGKLWVWETDNWTQVAAFNIDDDFVGFGDLAWSPDSSYLATGGWRSDIKIWDTTTWSQVNHLDGHTSLVDNLDWSADGSYLASSSFWDGTVRVWGIPK